MCVCQQNNEYYFWYDPAFSKDGKVEVVNNYCLNERMAIAKLQFIKYLQILKFEDIQIEKRMFFEDQQEFKKINADNIIWGKMIFY